MMHFQVAKLPCQPTRRRTIRSAKSTIVYQVNGAGSIVNTHRSNELKIKCIRNSEDVRGGGSCFRVVVHKHKFQRVKPGFIGLNNRYHIEPTVVQPDETDVSQLAGKVCRHTGRVEHER
jgi:hypothetical protein